MHGTNFQGKNNENTQVNEGRAEEISRLTREARENPTKCVQKGSPRQQRFEED